MREEGRVGVVLEGVEGALEVGSQGYEGVRSGTALRSAPLSPRRGIYVCVEFAEGGRQTM